MFKSRWTMAGITLALAALPLGAQETKIRTIGAGLEESIIWISGAELPNYRESFRGVLFSDKGEILTTWRNACVASNPKVNIGGSQVSARLVGVHPSRDLAVIQADLSTVNDRTRVKPAKLAGSAVSLGDQVMLWRSGQPIPAIVASETQPVDHPEYFWMNGKETVNAPFNNGGWGYQQLNPDDWVLNLKGEIQGLVARVIVNGTMTLRVIPVHDVEVKDFVAPSERRTDPAKAKELLQMAENLERDRYKPGKTFVPFVWNSSSVDYLRMALSEDLTNKDVLFKMGLTADDVKSSATGGGGGGSSESRKTPDPAAGKSNEQIDSEFVRSRVNTAIEHIRGNRIKLGQDILEDVVKNYPNHPEAKTARRLLDVIKGQK